MMENCIDIVLACDSNYAALVAVFIESFYQTNRSFSFARFHLLANQVKDEEIESLRRQIRENKGLLLTYDISNLETLLGIQVPNTIAISSYARLFVAELLPKDLDRVLYVDCDVIATDDLADLWKVDLGANLVAGVLDTLYDDSSKTEVGMQIHSEYVNAGVLLIPLKTWREENIKSAFLKVLEKYNGHVYHHDQGIINAVCERRTVIVHPRYNVMTTYFTHKYAYIRRLNTPFYSKEEYDEAVKNPALIHFTEGFYGRPWIKHCKHPYAGRFIAFRENTAWKDEPLRADERSLPLKVVSWTFLNTPLWCYNALQRVISMLKS
jgi:lipopolysaccharide biosynthesis glycosyltransferase